jgi:hypothetical protein
MKIVIIGGVFFSFVIISIILGLYFGGVFGQGETTPKTPDTSTTATTPPTTTPPTTTPPTTTPPTTTPTPTLKVVPSNIDVVFGWQGPHENPDLKNQTEEDCRQTALKDSKYVAYGYRTPDHPDPRWKNSCFLYTSGFGPFKGNPNDKSHKTGCLREGEKVEWGCKTNPPAVQVFEHCDYIGRSIDLGVGSYKLPFGMPNDTISSVKVPNGMKVTLFEHDNFQGRSITLTQDSQCLTNQNFNDTVSSIKVEMA